MKTLTLTIAATTLLLAACSKSSDIKPAGIADSNAELTAEALDKAAPVVSEDNSAKLKSILSAQSDLTKSRYPYRHPEKTLAFFEIKPDMHVAEVLPGAGWYSKILLPYLGPDGALTGIDYNIDMWHRFEGLATDKFLDDRARWAKTWSDTARTKWSDENSAKVSAFAFGQRPAELRNTVDAVLFIRAMHHLTRFDDAYLQQALADTKYILKPGGVVGIVQHRAPENSSDEWANGDNGYLKQSRVITLMQDNGFELIGQSDINANPKDKPGIADKVWRLPPTLGTSHDDPELRAKMEAIGESDRMTLKFRLKN